MANPRFAWGIDIGNRALKAVKLVRENETLRLDDIEVIEHEQVLSNSGDNREALIQAALANFVQRHPPKGNGVVAVGVSGQSSFARFIKLPPVDEKKIPEIVNFEAKQQIPFDLNDVEWAYQLFKPAEGQDVEVGIFAMRKELVNHHMKYFTDVNLNVQVVQMNPLAVYNAMHYDSRLNDGATMVLDLGAENADLIIADGESVWLRSISIGGNNFTEALVKAFKLSFAKAEELKRNAQTSKYARQIFQAMRPIFADLVAEIQRSIGFYSSVHRDSRIKRIIALGNTFRLPTLQKYLHQNLQIDVERLDTFTAGSLDDGRQAAMLSENIASMASAYGLALQAMGQGKIGSSLLPEDIRKAKVWKEKNKWFVAAASIAAVSAGLAFGWYYNQQQAFEQNKATQVSIDRVITTAKGLDSEWSRVENDGEDAKRAIQNVTALCANRSIMADLWADITHALPDENKIAPEEFIKNKTKRTSRKQLFIDRVATEYRFDISELVKLKDEDFGKIDPPALVPLDGAQPGAGGGNRRFGPGGEGEFRPREFGGGGGGGGRGGGGEGVPDPNVAVTATDRGFLIAIHGTSPHIENGQRFPIAEEFVERLKSSCSLEAALKAKKPYYIAKAQLVKIERFGNETNHKANFTAIRTARAAAKNAVDQIIMTELGGSKGSGGAPFNPGGRLIRGGGLGESERVPTREGGMRPLADPNTANAVEDEKEEFKDPFYKGEHLLDDSRYLVLIVVGLDPKPPVSP